MKYCLALLFLLLSSSTTTNALSFSNPSDGRRRSLSQKSVLRHNSNFDPSTTTRREPIRMPSQTPMVPYTPPGSDVAQFIDINAAQYRDRTVMMNKFIDEEVANELIGILLYLRKQDARAPISLYMNIPGGWLRPCLALYDLIQNTKKNCEIETVNLGLCAGMGAILCGAGTTGQRSAFPNSRFLLQRTGMDQVFRGQATDIGLEVKNVKSWNERMEKELSLLTGQPLDVIQQDLKRDFYLPAEEAVQYGLIDRVYLPAPRKRAARGQEANLGAFEGDEDQKYQGQKNKGGWGSQRPDQRSPDRKDNDNDDNDDDDDGPAIAKG